MNGSFSRKKIILIISSILLITLLFIYFRNNRLEFSEVYSESSCGTIRENSPYWICIKDNDLHGFFGVEYLDQYNVDYNEWDLEHYTYIVTFGYEMKKIEYSYSDCRNWHFSIIPNNYLGKLTLSGEKTDMIHIYRTKRVDIEQAYPIGPEEIIFQE